MTTEDKAKKKMNVLEKWAIDVKISLVNYQETYGDNDFSNDMDYFQGL